MIFANVSEADIIAKVRLRLLCAAWLAANCPQVPMGIVSPLIPPHCPQDRLDALAKKHSNFKCVAWCRWLAVMAAQKDTRCRGGGAAAPTPSHHFRPACPALPPAPCGACLPSG